jgi:NADH dehydrogenase
MATIGRFRAVAKIGRFELSGTGAWLLWLVVHVAYLTGFRNKFTAVLHWATSFLGHSRSQRTATEQQVFGREALAHLPGGAADLVRQPSGARPRRRGVDSQEPGETEAARTELITRDKTPDEVS